MSTNEFIKKYPQVEDYFNKGIIDLNRIGDEISIITKLKLNNDNDSIKKLGLSDFFSDMRKVFGTTKEFTMAQREKKFERIFKVEK
jgi:hypothetical protein